jgi:hypothetical protein
MKRVGDDAPFTGVILPHEFMLANFDPRRGPCCTVENFTIEILGTPKSTWNISASKVFARDFVAHYPDYQYDAVKKAFSTHVRSLKRAYKQAALDEAASKARQKEDRRKERKRSVCINGMVFELVITSDMFAAISQAFGRCSCSFRPATSRLDAHKNWS